VRVCVRSESWQIAGGFRLARGARSAAEVVVLELEQDGLTGRSECVPYARYGESVASVRHAIEAACASMGDRPSREALQTTMPAGAARNAVDCALWDLEAKRAGIPVWQLAGLRQAPAPLRTMRTLSIDTPERMGRAAQRLADPTIIKLKVDGGGDLARIAAVHRAVPSAALVVDANESWSVEQLRRWLPELGGLGVELLEQPLPAGRDEALNELRGGVPICADESFHDRQSFEEIGERYDVVNIKLDKTGGLTEALRCAREARDRSIQIMVGCMVCTSLGIEPALLLAQDADHVDLDGALLLERDRDGARSDSVTGQLRSSPILWGSA
jgi:L-alanine-DL-glutamate epimerase-like enolase superfamily enzyme